MTLMFDSACAYVGKDRDANLAHARSLGASVISCYIVGSPGGCPHTTAADVSAIRQLDMGALANWERAADFFRGATAAQCHLAGAEALQAMRDLGFPDGSVCYPSWDYDVLDGDYPAEFVKGQAFAAGLTSRYRLSAYSELGLIKYFVDHGLIAAGVKGWLCMSEGFGHFTQYDWQRYVAVVQQHNASKVWLNPTQPGTDINTILDPHALGAWWPASSPYGDDDVTAKDVWDYPLHAVDAKGQRASADHPASQWLTDTRRDLATVTANQAALQAALTAAAAGGADLSAVQAAAKAGAEEALAGLTLTAVVPS